MPLQITLNGEPRELPLPEDAVVTDLLQQFDLSGDRIAIERNGTILARKTWGEVAVQNGDKFEIVHFVGGGASSPAV